MRSPAPTTARTALELTIAELAPGGDGVAIAEVDGERRAVFTRGVAPGDRVRLAVDLSKRPARGRLVEVLTAGASRVPSPCAHVERCGGCDWMHVAAQAQTAAHEAHVRAALPRAWRAHPIEVHAAPATDALRYRERARLHVRASGGRAIVGMNEAGTRDPVEVDTCVVLRPELERARASLGPLLEGAHGTGDAQIALGAVPETDTPRKPVLDLRWSGALAPRCYAQLERAVADGAWAGARVVAGDTTRPATIGAPTPWMVGYDGEPLKLAPGGFGQASAAANARLAARVGELAASTSAERVVELYAGTGNLTVAIARAILGGARAEIIAVEAQREACEAAQVNLVARNLRARVIEEDAASFAWDKATSLIVLDPPRTGAREVAARLALSPVRHVLYVSCDAQTLGRDLAILCGEDEDAPLYAPVAIELFEMFPQTSHVETVVLLERSPSGARAARERARSGRTVDTARAAKRTP